MNKFISSISIFFISAIIHNLYTVFTNKITLILFPINESIWEHMKMIFTSYIIFLIFKYIYYKIKNINTNSLIFNEVILAALNIIIFLIIYLPIYYLFGENLVVTLIIYFITIFLTRKFEIKKDLNLLGLILIIIIYSIFTYFSYNPLKLDIFKDPTNNTYGLNK